VSYQINDVFNSRLIKELGIPTSRLKDVYGRYSSPHRFCHGIGHIQKNHQKIKDALGLSPEERDILYLVNVYHDAVYIPWESSLEARSADLFLSHCTNKEHETAILIHSIIRNTSSDFQDCVNTKLSNTFNSIDRSILRSENMEELIRWETSIFKEYQFCALADYIKARTLFLEKFVVTNPKLKDLIAYIKMKSYKIAIYPGSFNPFHNGHLSVVENLEKSGNFDKVIIAVGDNPEKSSNTNRSDRVKKQLGYREILTYTGFLTEAVKDSGATAVIRGLRNGYDLNYEINQLRYLEDMGLEIPVLFLVCAEKYSHISSSAIRSIGTMDSKKAGEYIPEDLEIL